MRKVKSLKDINAREYFQIITIFDRMNKKEITAQEGIEKITIDIAKVDIKHSAKEVELFIGNLLQLINERKPSEFKSIFTVKGVKYGIEPSFESMESGAYQDLIIYIEAEKFIEALAIIYRPVAASYANKAYSITSYVDEANQSFDSRVGILGEFITAEEALGVIDFFYNSLLQ